MIRPPTPEAFGQLLEIAERDDPIFAVMLRLAGSGLGSSSLGPSRLCLIEYVYEP